VKSPRSSLLVKIFLVAFLNIILLTLVFSIFARSQFRLDLSSFFLAAGRDRMLSVSRLIALQLVSTPRESWTLVLDEYASNYPSHFYLFSETGEQLAGQPITLPAKVTASLQRENRRHFRHEWEGQERRSPPHPPRMQQPPPPLNLTRTDGPVGYWADVHIPLFSPRTSGGRTPPMHAVLIWNFSSFWTQPFFFDLKAWLGVVLATVLVSVACWLPLIRGLTRAITQLTTATGRIAEGHFEIEVATKRKDELGRLSDSISRMALRLSGLVHGQRRFLSDIAHELSSPIARAQLALAILEQRADPTQEEYVIDVREEVDHMSGLVGELLAFCKSQSIDSAVELTPVNVADTIRRVIEREGSDGVQIETQLDERVEVVAQPEYLFRSLANLLRNAIRYAAHAGPITVSAVERGQEVTITVSDSGPGLPENELENVFRPFYRPEFARQRETGGSGLGLAIVRSCVEACGGAVSCRNRSPRGLEVAIRLARAQGRTSSSPARTQLADASR
jgi:two-component system, OmpR family, sensor histidine kinase CpxA